MIEYNIDKWKKLKKNLNKKVTLEELIQQNKFYRL